MPSLFCCSISLPLPFLPVALIGRQHRQLLLLFYLIYHAELVAERPEATILFLKTTPTLQTRGMPTPSVFVQRPHRWRSWIAAGGSSDDYYNRYQHTDDRRMCIGGGAYVRYHNNWLRMFITEYQPTEQPLRMVIHSLETLRTKGSVSRLKGASQGYKLAWAAYLLKPLIHRERYGRARPVLTSFRLRSSDDQQHGLKGALQG